MINELYELAQAMQNSHVLGDRYAQNYNEVSYKKCVCVCIADGHISKISSITQAQKANIRNYTETSSGGFPCVKLAPLYRIADKDTMQMIKKMKKQPELLDASTLLLLRDCAIPANNNWDHSIVKKYEKANELASKIRKKLSACPCVPFDILYKEFGAIQHPDIFHTELAEAVFETLSAGIDVSLMLELLFFCKEQEGCNSKEEKRGEISILFDTESLYTLGMPVTSMKFAEELNTALLVAEQQKMGNCVAKASDGNSANAEMWSFSLREDSMLIRNNGMECSTAVLSDYFKKDIPIVPELSTQSMNDEIIRDDSCIKTIQRLMEHEEAMQFQTVDHAFTVIDSDTVPAVIDGSFAEAIARGKGNWHELQKKSVSIRRYKIREWGLREIAAGVYQWALGYDDFLGYMYGVLNMGAALFN